MRKNTAFFDFSWINESNECPSDDLKIQHIFQEQSFSNEILLVCVCVCVARNMDEVACSAAPSWSTRRLGWILNRVVWIIYIVLWHKV